MNKDYKYKRNKIYELKLKEIEKLEHERKMNEKIRVRCSCELVIERRFLSVLRRLLHDSVHTFNTKQFPEIKWIDPGRVIKLNKPVWPDEHKERKKYKNEKSINYDANGH